MVSPLGLLKLVEIVVEFRLGIEAGAVNALHLRVAFLALPVGAGDVHQLERADAPGRRNVRPAAEVEEFPGGVKRHHRLGGLLFDQLALKRLARPAVELERLSFGQQLALVGDVLRGELAHLGLDALEILRRKRLLAQKLVEEAVLDRRGDGPPSLWEKLQPLRGPQARGWMAGELER